MMRALHVFPLFGPELISNGSEYYEYMVTKRLVELGVQVDVFTTQSNRLRPTAAFGLRWDSDYEERVEQADGINIYRFPASFCLPTTLGHVLSWFVLKRWKKEEEEYGVMLKGSKNLVDHYYLRALSRPFFYDWLALLGRGPHSVRLLAAAVRSIHNYDVVLAGFVPFAIIWQLTVIARRFKKPIIILPLFHPEDLYHHFRVFYRCFVKANGILAQTPYSTELFKKLCPGSHAIQIGVGVDEDAFSNPNISGARFRLKYRLDGKKVILFVGRKEPNKRYDLAIKAIDLIHDERIKLIMIGTDVDKRPITSPHVVYLGNVSRTELIDAYDACDVFLLPSEHESFGIVFLEAWMRRKPVIGSASCGPVASIIKDGEDGFLCRDAEDIAFKIMDLLSQPSKAKRMGETGYRKTVSNYTWHVIGEKIYNLYRKVVVV